MIEKYVKLAKKYHQYEKKKVFFLVDIDKNIISKVIY